MILNLEHNNSGSALQIATTWMADCKTINFTIMEDLRTCPGKQRSGEGVEG